MPIAKVNGKEVEFEPGMTVLQVAELAGEEIPRFCYHERLSIAGNCRMCLVEVKPGPPKPQASCALPAADKQEIFTNTPMVKKAREGVMEFLLVNHPLDCPICDQGGECDLQDEAMGYGRVGSRYDENKRAVEEKFMGPLIKTVMTRCIQCTRCVRFATEVAGVSELGLVNRGENAEITTYLEGAVTSELSGNLVDLCPVGALTSKPYAFNARPWELVKTETIDVMDALGSTIRVDARGPAVLRVLPRTNDDVNEEWISDKTRHHVDGLSRQRLDRPYVRIDGRLQPATWGQAFAAIAAKVKATAPERMGLIAGDLQDAESMKAAMDLFRSLGVANIDCRQDGNVLGRGPREEWLFNSTIAGIDEADAIMIIGSNPRLESPVLNARIRRRWLTGKLLVGVVGEAADLTYRYNHLGAGPEALAQFASHGPISKERPMFLVGQGALNRPDSAAVLNLLGQAAKSMGVVKAGWNGFNILHTAASRVAGLDMGFLPGEGGRDVGGMLTAAERGELELVYLLGADEIDMSRLGKAFVIYQGSHGDAGAARADIVLPGAAYSEKPGIYVNTEGRAQIGARAVFPKGDAKEDWTILRALSEELGKKLPFDSLDVLRRKLINDHPTFGQIDMAPGHATAEGFDVGALGVAGEVAASPFVNVVTEFHLTNPIARASVVMAECARSVKAARGLAAAE